MYPYGSRNSSGDVYADAAEMYWNCRALMGDEYMIRGEAGGMIKNPYLAIMRDCAEIMAAAKPH